MDLEESAGKVSAIAVYQTVIVPYCKTDRIHDVQSKASADEDVEAIVLGHIPKSTVINVIFGACILQLCT